MTAVYHGSSRLVLVRYRHFAAAGRTVEEATTAMLLLLQARKGMPSC